MTHWTVLCEGHFFMVVSGLKLRENWSMTPSDDVINLPITFENSLISIEFSLLFRRFGGIWCLKWNVYQLFWPQLHSFRLILPIWERKLFDRYPIFWKIFKLDLTMLYENHFDCGFFIMGFHDAIFPNPRTVFPILIPIFPQNWWKFRE